MNEQMKQQLRRSRDALVLFLKDVDQIEDSAQIDILFKASAALAKIDEIRKILDKSNQPSHTIDKLFNEFKSDNKADYTLMVLRLEPQVIEDQKISGYLQTFHLPITIPDIIEKIEHKYGGGRYQIRIVDGVGKYVKSKTFEVSGKPKIPSDDV